MKPLFAVGIILLSIAVIFSGCKKSDSAPAVTQVKGTASFPAGTSGDLSNAKVSLYLTIDDWNSNSPVLFKAVTGGGASAAFTLADLNPGNYYLDVWKDIDNSGDWSSGDYIGWYGSGGLGSPALTPFQLTSGATFNCTVTMYIIAKNGMLRKMN